MALRTRPGEFASHDIQVQTEQLTAASRLVSYLTGFAVQPNKAIVGANAFAHESGIHQDGVLKNPLTYEIMTPQSVGLLGSSLTIGKLSGRRGLQAKLAELGHDLTGEALDALYREAIALADIKKELTDADLLALIDKRAATGSVATVELVDWSVASSHSGGSSGRVELRVNGAHTTAESTGNGPVDALYEAIDAAVEPVLGWRPVLAEYEIRAVSEGEDAQGQVTTKCRRSNDLDEAGRPVPNAPIVTGQGLSTNIIDASIVAYVTAINKLAALEAGAASAPTKGSREAMQ
jgi:2-isopropylmalate synthase